MICQNCQATVDNDLIFCTECGSRLTQNWNNAQSEATVVLNNPPHQTQRVKKSSPLKWNRKTLQY
jgi:predicted amidophosphoribosyltransferase